jgi:molecular chaperone GrpE
MAETNPTSSTNGPGQKTGTGEASPSETEVLRTRAETAEQERERFRDLALRTRAEFENYQKRQQRELAQERLYAHLPLAQDMLLALDNLDRALAEARKAGEAGPLAQGVAMVQSQLLDALRRHGITPIQAQGQPFDPNLHQAVMQQPSAEVEPMTVLQVLENGYKIHERVLRPARVIVSIAPAGAPEP